MRMTTVAGSIAARATSGVGTMGTAGTLYPPSSGLVPPCIPQVKDAAYVKILSKRL